MPSPKPVVVLSSLSTLNKPNDWYSEHWRKWCPNWTLENRCSLLINDLSILFFSLFLGIKLRGWFSHPVNALQRSFAGLLICLHICGANNVLTTRWHHPDVSRICLLRPMNINQTRQPRLLLFLGLFPLSLGSLSLSLLQFLSPSLSVCPSL